MRKSGRTTKRITNMLLKVIHKKCNVFFVTHTFTHSRRCTYLAVNILMEAEIKCELIGKTCIRIDNNFVRFGIIQDLDDDALYTYKYICFDHSID